MPYLSKSSSSIISISVLETKNKILLTDSRFLSQPENTVFVAIKGDRHDGHQFVNQLIERGVKDFIVSKDWLSANINLEGKANFHPADNTVKALQSLATKHRVAFELPVVGITGSNGKTIVKEWLSLILQNHFSLVKSPRSYNSQIGVPLSVCQINKNHDLGVLKI